MRDYGKVHTSFWTSQSIRKLSEDGRVLAMYLLTCPHGTIAGVFRVPDGYASDDLQWVGERVAKGFDELLRNGFATRCEVTKWVWITKHFEWNPPENPNQKKAAKKIAFQIPDECCWKLEFMGCYANLLGLESVQRNSPCETLTEGFLNQEQEQEQEQEQGEPSPSASLDDDSASVEKVKTQKAPSVVFRTFLSECKAKGESPIPENDPVFDWAEKAGLPVEFLRLAWIEFKSRYVEGDKSTKRYQDWRKVFRNVIRDNWFKLWYSSENGEIVLTSQGRLIEKTHSKEIGGDA